MLAALVREHLQGDPLSCTWFVFRDKQENQRKILYWDRDSYALWSKRLKQGAFEFLKVTGIAAGGSNNATELSLIVGGVALSAKCRLHYVKSEKTLEPHEISRMFDRAAVFSACCPQPRSPILSSKIRRS